MLAEIIRRLPAGGHILGEHTRRLAWNVVGIDRGHQGHVVGVAIRVRGLSEREVFMGAPPEGSGGAQAAWQADGGEPPPGNHALEVGARAGIGPLSALGREVWHGHAKPCVSCGQLVQRDGTECSYCGQDLSEAMLAKMRSHAGPWYVLEHVRPFPGVSLERIIRQIRRGVLTETSIVRGPATDFQWRFAVETPGLCRYFDRCWHCYEEVRTEDTHCPACLSQLTFEQCDGRTSSVRPTTRDRFTPQAAVAATEPLLKPAAPIQELTSALGQSEAPPRNATSDGAGRVGRISVTWVVALMLTAAVVVLIWLTHVRNRSSGGERPAPQETMLSPHDTVD
ncbi:MAG: hypothetical protein ACE5HE_05365 [Phycisphaerae bacterium]